MVNSTISNIIAPYYMHILEQAIATQKQHLKKFIIPTLFWQEIQQAYSRRFLEKLESLTATTEGLCAFLAEQWVLFGASLFSPFARPIDVETGITITLASHCAKELGCSPESLMFPGTQCPPISNIASFLTQAFYDPLQQKIMLIKSITLDTKSSLNPQLQRFLSPLGAPMEQEELEKQDCFINNLWHHSPVLAEIRFTQPYYKITKNQTTILNLLEGLLAALNSASRFCLGVKNNDTYHCYRFFENTREIISYCLNASHKVFVHQQFDHSLMKILSTLSCTDSSAPLTAQDIKNAARSLRQVLCQKKQRRALNGIKILTIAAEYSALEQFQQLLKLLHSEQYCGFQHFPLTPPVLSELGISFCLRNPRDLELLYTMTPSTLKRFFETDSEAPRLQKQLWQQLTSWDDFIIMCGALPYETLGTFFQIFYDKINTRFLHNLEDISRLLLSLPLNTERHNRILQGLMPHLTHLILKEPQHFLDSHAWPNFAQSFMLTILSGDKNISHDPNFIKFFIALQSSQHSQDYHILFALTPSRWAEQLIRDISLLPGVIASLPDSQAPEIITQCFAHLETSISSISSLPQLLLWLNMSQQFYTTAHQWVVQQLSADDFKALRERLMQALSSLENKEISEAFFGLLHHKSFDTEALLPHLLQQQGFLEMLLHHTGNLKQLIAGLQASGSPLASKFIELFSENDFERFKQIPFCPINTLFLFDVSCGNKKNLLKQWLLNDHAHFIRLSCCSIDKCIGALSFLMNDPKFDLYYNLICGKDHHIIVNILRSVGENHPEKFCDTLCRWYRFTKIAPIATAKELMKHLRTAPAFFPRDIPEWGMLNSMFNIFWRESTFDYKHLLFLIEKHHGLDFFVKIIPTTQALCTFITQHSEHQPSIYKELINHYIPSQKNSLALPHIIHSTTDLKKIMAFITKDAARKRVFQYYVANHYQELFSLWEKSLENPSHDAVDPINEVIETFSDPWQVIEIIQGLFHFHGSQVASINFQFPPETLSKICDPVHSESLKKLVRYDLHYGLNFCEKVFAHSTIPQAANILLSLTDSTTDQWSLLRQMLAIDNPQLPPQQLAQELSKQSRLRLITVIAEYLPERILCYTLTLTDLDNQLKTISHESQEQVLSLLSGPLQQQCFRQITCLNDLNIALKLCPQAAPAALVLHYWQNNPTEFTEQMITMSPLLNNTLVPFLQELTAEELRPMLLKITPGRPAPEVNTILIRQFSLCGVSFSRIAEALNLDQQARLTFAAYIFHKQIPLKDFVPFLAHSVEDVISLMKTGLMQQHHSSLTHMLFTDNFKWFDALCPTWAECEKISPYLTAVERGWVMSHRQKTPMRQELISTQTSDHTNSFSDQNNIYPVLNKQEALELLFALDNTQTDEAASSQNLFSQTSPIAQQPPIPQGPLHWDKTLMFRQDHCNSPLLDGMFEDNDNLDFDINDLLRSEITETHALPAPIVTPQPAPVSGKISAKETGRKRKNSPSQQSSEQDTNIGFDVHHLSGQSLNPQALTVSEQKPQGSALSSLGQNPIPSSRRKNITKGKGANGDNTTMGKKSFKKVKK